MEITQKKRVLLSCFSINDINLMSDDEVMKAYDSQVNKVELHNQYKFSYQWETDLVLPFAKDPNEVFDVLSDEQVTILNDMLKDFVKNNPIRRGDIIHFSYYGNYRNVGKFIYDGTKFIDLDYEKDDYGAVPEHFYINDFPRTDYFCYTVAHNIYVSYDLSRKTYEYVGNFRGLRKYKTVEGFYIYTKSQELTDNTFEYADYDTCFSETDEFTQNMKNGLFLIDPSLKDDDEDDEDDE